MRLFHCRLVTDIVVYADTVESAEELALCFEPDERHHAHVENSKQIIKPEDAPKGWMTALPYGRSDDVTVAEILGVSPGELPDGEEVEDDL